MLLALLGSSTEYRLLMRKLPNGNQQDGSTTDLLFIFVGKIHTQQANIGIWKCKRDIGVGMW